MLAPVGVDGGSEMGKGSGEDERLEKIVERGERGTVEIKRDVEREGLGERRSVVLRRKG